LRGETKGKRKWCRKYGSAGARDELIDCKKVGSALPKRNKEEVLKSRLGDQCPTSDGTASATGR
jgi:hypothetical protein